MKRMPLISFVLGVLSPLPLVVMAFIMMFYSPQTELPMLLPSFVGYAGIILAFIGGINWILAMQKPVILLESDTNFINKRRLLIAIVPCIFAQISIMLTANQQWVLALLLLIIGYTTTLFLEGKSYLPAEQPVGYRAIRRFTTIVIQLCLVGALVFRAPW